MVFKVCCPRCNHEWNYKGISWWITCPVCRKLFRNEEITFTEKDIKKE